MIVVQVMKVVVFYSMLEPTQTGVNVTTWTMTWKVVVMKMMTAVQAMTAVVVMPICSALVHRVFMDSSVRHQSLCAPLQRV